MSWLRIVTYRLPTTGAAAAVEAVQADTGEVVRILEQQPGFGGAYWADSPEDNTVSSISHWSSLEAIEAAQAALARIRAIRAGAIPGISVLEEHNIGLFAVPGITGWFDDETDNEGAESGRRHAYQRLHPARLARWRH